MHFSSCEGLSELSGIVYAVVFALFGEGAFATIAFHNASFTIGQMEVGAIAQSRQVLLEQMAESIHRLDLLPT